MLESNVICFALAALWILITAGVANKYYTEYDCVLKYCATTNETLAKNWDACAEAAVKTGEEHRGRRQIQLLLT